MDELLSTVWAFKHSNLSRDDCEESSHEIWRLCIQSDGLDVMEDGEKERECITLITHFNWLVLRITKDCRERRNVDVGT